MNFKSLKEIGEIKGKTVLVRLDFNVPIEAGVVVDDYRIRSSLPTISYLKQKGAKIVIIAHVENEPATLMPVYERLRKDAQVLFCDDVLKNGKHCIENMTDGDVLLCENIRMYKGEKANDEEFAKELASLGEIYVNDAFSVSHREHASIVGLPKYLPAYAGLQFEEEIKNLSQCFSPEHPFLFILGGAKFETKMPLVEKFLKIADEVFIGGALYNEMDKNSEIAKNPKVTLPIDFVISDGKALDAGEKTVELLKEKVAQAKFILWNGPLGQYEKGFVEPTRILAQAISESSAFSLLGGGDTVAAISELGLEDKFGFVSTGGGAMLDFLANGTLPGLEALGK